MQVKLNSKIKEEKDFEDLNNAIKNFIIEKIIKFSTEEDDQNLKYWIEVYKKIYC